MSSPVAPSPPVQAAAPLPIAPTRHATPDGDSVIEETVSLADLTATESIAATRLTPDGSPGLWTEPDPFKASRQQTFPTRHDGPVASGSSSRRATRENSETGTEPQLRRRRSSRQSSIASANLPPTRSSTLYSPARNVFPLVKPGTIGQRKESGSEGPSKQPSPLPTPWETAAPPTGTLTPRSASPLFEGPAVDPSELNVRGLRIDSIPCSESAGSASQSISARSAETDRIRPTTTSSSSPAASTAAPTEPGSPSPSPQKKAILARPTYTSSLAPTHAQKYLASTAQPVAGPSGSIFQTPTPTARSARDLVPKKKLSSLLFSSAASPFGKRKGRPESTTAAPTRSGSASVLDAALAASATWATRRGEVGANYGSSPSASSFGPNGSPSLSVGPRQAYMGNVPDNPVTERAIAEAFSRGAAAAAAGPPSEVSSVRSSLALDSFPIPPRAPSSSGLSQLEETGAPTRTSAVFPTRPKPTFPLRPRAPIDTASPLPPGAEDVESLAPRLEPAELVGRAL